MQRSYNAFAVRVQGEEGTKRRVVPANETDEGELCIEMRIRLYPDGLMSSLLLQLIKVRRRDGRLTAGRILIAIARYRFDGLTRRIGWRGDLCSCNAGAVSPPFNTPSAGGCTTFNDTLQVCDEFRNSVYPGWCGDSPDYLPYDCKYALPPSSLFLSFSLHVLRYHAVFLGLVASPFLCPLRILNVYLSNHFGVRLGPWGATERPEPNEWPID